ncbi:MAG: VOC family protein [Candidatus Magasanikbacteria bacterium]|jgi:hypothetical protein
MNELIIQATPFLEKIFQLLEKDGIDVSEYELDHICYRVEINERYNQLKNKFSQLGNLINEEEIGGRPISTFRLNQPIEFAERKINCLELPSPKMNSFYSEGYEHIEFIII